MDDFGMLGLAEIVSNKCCGFPKTMIAYPPKLDHAVRLRLHTSDTMVFGNVFMDEEYSFGLASSANVIVDAGAICRAHADFLCEDVSEGSNLCD